METKTALKDDIDWKQKISSMLTDPRLKPIAKRLFRNNGELTTEAVFVRSVQNPRIKSIGCRLQPGEVAVDTAALHLIDGARILSLTFGTIGIVSPLVFGYAIAQSHQSSEAWRVGAFSCFCCFAAATFFGAIGFNRFSNEKRASISQGELMKIHGTQQFVRTYPLLSAQFAEQQLWGK